MSETPKDAAPEAVAVDPDEEAARLLGARIQGLLLGIPLFFAILAMLGADPASFRYEGF